MRTLEQKYNNNSLMIKIVALAVLLTLAMSHAVDAKNKQLISSGKNVGPLTQQGSGITPEIQVTVEKAISFGTDTYGDDYIDNSAFVPQLVEQQHGGQWTCFISTDPTFALYIYVVADRWLLWGPYGAYGWYYVLWQSG